MSKKVSDILSKTEILAQLAEEKQGFYGYAWDTKDGKTGILKVTIKQGAVG